MVAVVLGVGRLGTQRREKEESSECGAERQRRGCILKGQGGDGEEGRRAVAVEFYSSSFSKELKGEEEMGHHRFSGGSEGGMTALRFGSSRAEEGGSQQRTARRRSRRGGGADGSWRWEPMERRKWAECRNGPKAKEAAA
jgi:hypothetical protein